MNLYNHIFQFTDAFMAFTSWSPKLCTTRFLEKSGIKCYSSLHTLHVVLLPGIEFDWENVEIENLYKNLSEHLDEKWTAVTTCQNLYESQYMKYIITTESRPPPSHVYLINRGFKKRVWKKIDFHVCEIPKIKGKCLLRKLDMCKCSETPDRACWCSCGRG